MSESMTLALRPTEKDFLAQVCQLATIRGWEYLHLRPARTADSWRTPISGSLGKGWPDLLLMRASDQRIIFSELKREDGKLTPEQERVMDFLGGFTNAWWHESPDGHWTMGVDAPSTLLEAYVWKPADWPEIERILR